MSRNQHRILRELKSCQKVEEYQISFLFSSSDNINHWTCFLLGPQDSPYQSGIFELDIKFPSEYPIVAPKVKFITTVFHPNIHQVTGEICLEVLKNDWRPYWTIESIMRAIHFLLANPNQDSPLNCDAGNLIRNQDIQAFNALATIFTKQYALSQHQFNQFLQQLQKQYAFNFTYTNMQQNNIEQKNKDNTEK